MNRRFQSAVHFIPIGRRNIGNGGTLGMRIVVSSLFRLRRFPAWRNERCRAQIGLATSMPQIPWQIGFDQYSSCNKFVQGFSQVVSIHLQIAQAGFE